VRTERPAPAYRLAVGGVLAGFAALVAWNAWSFDWLRGYDAVANEHYATVVATEHRLPSVAESSVWHTPPLWFALVGWLRRLASAAGWESVHRPGQLVAALAGVCVCIVILLLARELWPDRRVVHVVALVVAATSPALVRASAMYHPETLSTALGAGGMLAAVRGLRRGPTLANGLVAGALLGLASLTRAWALPVLLVVAVAYLLDGSRSGRRAPALALALVAGVLVVPWLAHQQASYGSPLVFNRDAPDEPLFHRRPKSFYLGPRALRVFEHPVTPVFRNELVPQLYADWWGDWALTWDAPLPPPPAGLLPSHVVAERARQAFVGFVPTVVALAGLLALCFLAAARRSLALGLIPASSLAVLAAFLVFTIRYPSTDGDTIKATYLLLALPGTALGAGLVLDRLRSQSRLGLWAVALALAVLAAVQAPFLVL